jgi:hypothetical protein
MMSKLARLGRAGVPVAMMAILVACAGQPAGATPAPTPTAAPSVEAVTPVPPSAPPATASPVASDQPAATAASSNEAPLATLVVDGDAQHPGEVGGFDFERYTQSAPWLPATALERIDVAAGSDLRVRLDDRATVAEWSASYAAADDSSGSVLMGLGSGGPTAGFGAPPPGDWVVSVNVVYGDGAGSGSYYWHVVVG